MDHLGQISLENTVTVKIDYNLNQDLLVKNFSIIINCLKDLKSQQDKHTADLSGLAGLKEMFDRFKEELRVKEEKNGQSANTNKAAMQSLQKQIDALKNRMTKNQGQTSNNKNGINNLVNDMSGVKQEIQNIKNQLQKINTLRISSQQGDKNSQKNDTFNQDILNDLNKQAQEQSALLLKFMKQLKDMKQNIKKIEHDLQNLKNNGDKGQIGESQLSDLIKKVEFLTNKSQELQNEIQSNSKSIDELNGISEENAKSIDGLEKEIEKIYSQIERLSKLKNNSAGNNNANSNRNTDNSQLINEIQKLKEQYEKLLKLVNALKTDKNENGNNNQTERLSAGGKNTNKLSRDQSFRKRSQSFDITGKIRQLSDRIKALEKMLAGNGDDNPEKLPSIGLKRPNLNNGQRSHKKEMAEIKNDLEIWIKSYIDNNMPRNNAANLADLELKIQQIRTNLSKKADHEGMKKGLAFLEGKITQLYLFLTEPESEDAMIVRKGFNCLSCSKKVQSLRGKLGPRMNWDNLNTAHHNSMHTPPKAGFPKYNDSNERESI